MAATEEIRNRLRRLQGTMTAEGYSAVVLAGNTEFQQKGYIRYFADWRLFGGSAYMVVPASGDPVLIMGLGAQAEWARDLGAVPDTRAVLDKIEGVCDALRDVTRAGDRVGVVGLNAIVPHGDALRLVAGLDGVALVDATDMVESFWNILSVADTQTVEASHARVARVFDAFRDALRPDRTEREVVADAPAAKAVRSAARGRRAIREHDDHYSSRVVDRRRSGHFGDQQLPGDAVWWCRATFAGCSDRAVRHTGKVERCVAGGEACRAQIADNAAALFLPAAIAPKTLHEKTIRARPHQSSNAFRHFRGITSTSQRSLKLERRVCSFFAPTTACVAHW